jgi:Tfp pilus assembly protein PilE
LIVVKLNKKMAKKITLVEISLSIFILSLLLAGVTIARENMVRKNRDIQGKNDIRKIANALQYKYNETLSYPDLPDFNLPQQYQKIPPEDKRLAPYLSTVPTGNGVREYFWFDDGTLKPQKFCVYFQLEADPSSYFSCTRESCQVSKTICPDF